MKRLILSLIFLPLLGWADSINLVNDSSTILQAIVTDFSGKTLAQFTLNPGSTMQWSDDTSSIEAVNTPSPPQPPYSVYWYCPQGILYSSCNYLASGSSVSAQGCLGNQQCTPPPAQQP